MRINCAGYKAALRQNRKLPDLDLSRLHGLGTALLESQAPVIAGLGFLPNGSMKSEIS
jgi:hypothetical protein